MGVNGRSGNNSLTHPFLFVGCGPCIPRSPSRSEQFLRDGTVSLVRENTLENTLEKYIGEYTGEKYTFPDINNLLKNFPHFYKIFLVFHTIFSIFTKFAWIYISWSSSPHQSLELVFMIGKNILNRHLPLKTLFLTKIFVAIFSLKNSL